MPAGQRPLIRRRLRLELRQERERANKSQTEVAKKMDWSLSKVIRLEAGQVGISTNDLKALLDLYNITDTERRSSLLDLARTSRQHSAWWTAYRDIVPSTEYYDFLGYENDAVQLSGNHVSVIPSLMQTEDYAREVIRSGGPLDIAEDQIERLVQLRLARQEHVLDREKPLRVTAFVQEGALRQVIGGAEVMNDQLTSVAEVATMENVTVHVVPFSAGAHAGMSGPFKLLEFPDPLDPPVLQFDLAPRNVILRDNPEQLRMYQRALEKLRRVSLSPDESIAYINRIAEEILEEGDTEGN